ncbi:ABC transporter [Mycena filopes]|nr:ABC transporter [Mycena filopes]
MSQAEKSDSSQPPLPADSETVDSVVRDEKVAAQASEPEYLTGKKLAVVFVAMILVMFLTSLDQTILATALPRIASDFNSFSLQGWVSSAFILAQAVFLLFYGQLLRIFPAKWVLVASVTIFEVGSLLCGVAQKIGQLIAGRTVSGLGAAGIVVSVLQVLSQTARLEDRARLFGLFGAVYGLASIIGPLMGGAFTDHVTWRWVFFLNLPLGFVAIIAIVLILKSVPPLGSDPMKRSNRDIFHQVLRVDYVGAVLVAGSVTTLELALQWGGNTKPWRDKAVIICFVFAAVQTCVFIAWEGYMGERAMTPSGIFKSRSMSVPSIISITFVYIPIFYQASRGHSATKSGLDLLPLMLSAVISVIAAGQIAAKTGYYWPLLVTSPLFLATGSGLLYTVTNTTSSAKLIGFQVLTGMGIGLGMQNTLLAVQVEFKDEKKLLAQAMSMNSFAAFLGGSIGLAIAEPVFASNLGKNLGKYAPEAPAAIVSESPTAIWSGALPQEMIAGVARSYAESLRLVFVIGVPLAGLALLSTVMIKNIKIQKGT